MIYLGNNLPVQGQEQVPFGTRLRSLREEKKLTQQQVADKIGFSLRQYRGYEKSDHAVSIKGETLICLADLFNVSVDYLLGRTNYRHVGNAEISKITGLNDLSIETLRYLNMPHENQLPDAIRFNRLTIDMINHGLGDIDTRKRIKYGKEQGTPVVTIFSELEKYLYPGNITATVYRQDSSTIYQHRTDGNQLQDNYMWGFHNGAQAERKREFTEFTLKPASSYEGNDILRLISAQKAYEAIQFESILELLVQMKEHIRKSQEVELNG